MGGGGAPSPPSTSKIQCHCRQNMAPKPGQGDEEKVNKALRRGPHRSPGSRLVPHAPKYNLIHAIESFLGAVTTEPSDIRTHLQLCDFKSFHTLVLTRGTYVPSPPHCSALCVLTPVDLQIVFRLGVTLTGNALLMQISIYGHNRNRLENNSPCSIVSAQNPELFVTSYVSLEKGQGEGGRGR